MKKIILPILAVALLAPMFSGCSISKEHNTLYKQWEEFSSSEEYSQYFNGNIDFSAAIQSQKNVSSSPYHTLNYCETLIKLSFQNVNQFYGLFQVTPQHNKNQTRTLCFNVQNKLQDFKEKVEVFNQNKQSLEITVDNFGVNSDAATKELKDFMIYIGNLASSANNLQVSFTKALSVLYSLPIKRDTAGTSLDVETAVNQVQSSLINDYVQYAIIKHKMVHPNNTTPLYNAIISLNNKLQNNVCLTSSYVKWVDTFVLFEAEQKMFKSSLKHVNLMHDNLNLSGKALQHFEKVENYMNTNAELFVNKTISLLY